MASGGFAVAEQLAYPQERAECGFLFSAAEGAAMPPRRANQLIVRFAAPRLRIERFSAAAPAKKNLRCGP